MTSFTHIATFEVVHCYKCGIAFAMPEDFKRLRLSLKDTFYCPAGHGQAYVGASDKDRAQQLASQLDMERTRRRQIEHDLDYARRATKAASTRLKNVKHRVANGVCPCCQRTFKQLAQHMATKHPSYQHDQATS